jgi:membrane-associated phospholipid phosphatase
MDESIIGALSPGELALNNWYRWGMELIRAIQGPGPENPALTALVKALTLLGSELFYVPAALFIYWCVDERKGQRLVLLLLLSTWLNTALKNLLKQPRPYFLDPSLGRAQAAGYGLPSGHAQQSLVFWAAALSGGPRRRTAWIIAAAVTLVIGFTRLYLGVHFPTDLAGGWLLALGLLAFSGLFGTPLADKLLAAGGPRMRMIAVAGAAFVMNALSPGDPRLGALFLGFGAGYTLMIRSFPFSAVGPGDSPLPPWLHRPLRFVLGAAGALLIYRGFGAFRDLSAGAASFLGAYELGRFLHYGLLGLWASAGAPWLFLRLHLAIKNEE